MVMSETTASKLQHQHWRNRLLSVPVIRRMSQAWMAWAERTGASALPPYKPRLKP